MKLEEAFERVVVINLSWMPERRERIEFNLLETGISSKWEWFDAIDGSKIEVPFWWRSGGPAFGCYQSHMAVIEKAMNDRVASVFILEDDARFTPDAAGWLKLLMADIPGKWDQIYLGGQHVRTPWPTKSPRWVASRGTVRTHAYGIHGSQCGGVWHFLQRPQSFVGRRLHIDHHFSIGHFRGDVHAIAPVWWLAGQAGGISSVLMRYVERRWWQDERHAKAVPFVHSVERDKRLYFHPGLDQAIRFRGTMRSWVRTAAVEALKQAKLPAFDGIPVEVIARDWPAGVFEYAAVADDLERLMATPGAVSLGQE